MSLIKWDPFRELEEVSDRLNRLFARPGARAEGAEKGMAVTDWTPAVDISETDTAYLIKAELPEVKKEDVKVTLDRGMLTIEGERRQESEEKNQRFHRIERSYGRCVRSFQVPDGVDTARIGARFDNGVLAITLPKSEKTAADVKKVEIA